jgi:hypothetical protein
MKSISKQFLLWNGLPTGTVLSGHQERNSSEDLGFLASQHPTTDYADVQARYEFSFAVIQAIAVTLILGHA